MVRLSEFVTSMMCLRMLKRAVRIEKLIIIRANSKFGCKSVNGICKSRDSLSFGRGLQDYWFTFGILD